MFDPSPWLDRPGTIVWMLEQEIGTVVTLDVVMVEEIGGGYLVIREPFDVNQRVMVEASARVVKYQSVEVTGIVAATSSGQIYLADAHVRAYVDSAGNIMLPPLV